MIRNRHCSWLQRFVSTLLLLVVFLYMVPFTGFYFALWWQEKCNFSCERLMLSTLSFLFPLLPKANERTVCMAAKLISFFFFFLKYIFFVWNGQQQSVTLSLGEQWLLQQLSHVPTGKPGPWCQRVLQHRPQASHFHQPHQRGWLMGQFILNLSWDASWDICLPCRAAW